jgi:hypothetical protein
MDTGTIEPDFYHQDDLFGQINLHGDCSPNITNRAHEVMNQGGRYASHAQGGTSAIQLQSDQVFTNWEVEMEDWIRNSNLSASLADSGDNDCIMDSTVISANLIFGVDNANFRSR